MIDLSLYTRRGCCLCEEMKTAIDDAIGGFPVRLEEIDVDANPDFTERFGADVPVLFVEGQEFARHRLDRKALRERLRRAGAPSEFPGGRP